MYTTEIETHGQLAMMQPLQVRLALENCSSMICSRKMCATNLQRVYAAISQGRLFIARVEEDAAGDDEARSEEQLLECVIAHHSLVLIQVVRR